MCMRDQWLPRGALAHSVHGRSVSAEQKGEGMARAEMNGGASMRHGQHKTLSRRLMSCMQRGPRPWKTKASNRAPHSVRHMACTRPNDPNRPPPASNCAPPRSSFLPADAPPLPPPPTKPLPPRLAAPALAKALASALANHRPQSKTTPMSTSASHAVTAMATDRRRRRCPTRRGRARRRRGGAPLPQHPPAASPAASGGSGGSGGGGGNDSGKPLQRVAGVRTDKGCPPHPPAQPASRPALTPPPTHVLEAPSIPVPSGAALSTRSAFQRGRLACQTAPCDRAAACVPSAAAAAAAAQPTPLPTLLPPPLPTPLPPPQPPRCQRAAVGSG